MNYDQLIEASNRIQEVKDKLMDALDGFHASKSPLKVLFKSWYFGYGNLMFRTFDQDWVLDIKQIRVTGENFLALSLDVYSQHSRGATFKSSKSFILTVNDLDDTDKINIDYILKFLVDVTVPAC